LPPRPITKAVWPPTRYRTHGDGSKRRYAAAAPDLLADSAEVFEPGGACMRRPSYVKRMCAIADGFSTDEKCPVFGSVTMRELFNRPLVRSRSGSRDQSLSP
jgi:hypothetical protein